MCRVVASKTEPGEKYAPFSIPGTPARTTKDIIPAILPEPVLVPSHNAFTSIARSKAIAVKLSSLLNFQLSGGEEHSSRVESGLVKQYSLSNPGEYFEQLLKDDRYEKEVRRLLDSVRPHHAYLVTGFLTATGSKWTTKGKTSSAMSADGTIPVPDAAGLPPPLVDNVGISLQFLTDTAKYEVQKSLAEEFIFAASYSVVKYSYAVGWSSNFISRSPRTGRSVRAKAHHLAFGNDDDEEIDCDSEEEAISDMRPAKGLPDADKYPRIIALSHQRSYAETDREIYIDLD